MKRPRLLHRLKRAAQAALLAASSLVLVLVALELAVRLLAPQQLIRLRPDVWIPDDGLGWRHAPNLDVRVNTGERTVRLLTDGDGFRIGERTIDRPRYRILALGDSFLEAIQVPYEDTLGAHLEALLASELGAPVRVVNAGVGGWDPNHYLIQARLELPRRSYDAVVVFLFAGNDVVAWRRDRIPPRPSRRAHRLRLPRSLAAGELIDAVAYPINDALETRSHLFILLKNRFKFLLMRLGLSQHYVPATLSTATRDQPAWEITADLARDIADEAEARGLPSLFVLLPGLYQVDPEIGRRYAGALGIDPSTLDLDQPSELLAPLFARRGLELIDATPALRRALQAGERELYGRVDTHLGPAGHRRVAELVAPLLAARLGGGGDRMDR